MELKAQSKWRWGVALYLFLAGLGGGAYILGVVADFLGSEWASVARTGIVLGFPCVFMGTVIKVMDLGTPKNAWRAGFKPGTSWMARGTLILTIFMGLGALHIALWIWPFADVLADAKTLRLTLGVVGAVFALGTMFYTGILLAAAKPIAFWSTAMLPLLFLLNAFMSGIMAVVMVGLLTGQSLEGPIAQLEYYVAVLLALTALVLVFYLQSTHRVPESRASAKLVLHGRVAPLFWFGVVVVGLAIPLGMGLFDLLQVYGGGAEAAAVIASLCGLAGGLFLRQVILAGGIHAPLRAGRFEIPLPIV